MKMSGKNNTWPENFDESITKINHPAKVSDDPDAGQKKRRQAKNR
jgi:hypothetical protein